MTRAANEAVNAIFRHVLDWATFQQLRPAGDRTWRMAARRVCQHVYDKNSPKKREKKKKQKDSSGEQAMTHEKAYEHLRQIQLNPVRPAFSLSQVPIVVLPSPVLPPLVHSSNRGADAEDYVSSRLSAPVSPRCQVDPTITHSKSPVVSFLREETRQRAVSTDFPSLCPTSWSGTWSSFLLSSSPVSTRPSILLFGDDGPSPLRPRPQLDDDDDDNDDEHDDDLSCISSLFDESSIASDAAEVTNVSADGDDLLLQGDVRPPALIIERALLDLAGLTKRWSFCGFADLDRLFDTVYIQCQAHDGADALKSVITESMKGEYKWDDANKTRTMGRTTSHADLPKHATP